MTTRELADRTFDFVRVWAVLLAAGESTRMGELKALLPWEGRALLRYQVDQLLATPIERVVIVLGFQADELVALIPSDDRVSVVRNLDYASGKVSSILAGVALVSGAPERAAPHVLIVGVDQPRSAALFSELCAIHSERVWHGGSDHVITIAGYRGRRGHPVLFGPALIPELRQISEQTEGLRSVLVAHAKDVIVVETGDPLALVNLNRPEDYQAALRMRSTSSERAGNQ